MYRSRNMFKKVILFSVLFPVLVLAYANPGKRSGFINDYAGILTNDQKTALENKLVSFERETGNEIAIVAIPNLGGDTIENFAVKLFEDWKIGKKGKDNGILILITKEDRKIKIEVGYGLEGALTDVQSFWIIDKIMKPAFQQENYYQGIEGAVDKIIAATKGEKIPEEATGNKTDYFSLFFFLFIILTWLTSILSRSKSWWAGGVIGGIIGVVLGIIKGFLFFGLISMAVLIPLGLLFDFKVSKAYKAGKEKGKIPWWAGGGRGGGGFSGSGFGGFGGGRSGGGGASSGW